MRVFKTSWPIGLALLALAAAWLCFTEAWDQLNIYHTVFYYSQESTFLLACLIVPLGLLLVIFQMRRTIRNIGSRRRLASIGISIFVLISANVIACGALPSLHNTYHNLSNIYLANHLYRLDTITTGVWSDLTEDLLLWECDSTGWFCRVIYSKEYFSDMVLKLTSEPNTNKLSLMINDTVVFTTRP